MVTRTWIDPKIIEIAFKTFDEDMKSLKRHGLTSVLNFLYKSDFFTAPASTKYHSNAENGLLVHSYFVRENALKIGNLYNLEHDSLILTAWLHDVCKIGLYETYDKNIKVTTETGRNQWIQITEYKITENEEFPMGHGSKSVLMLLKLGLEMNDDEVSAILNHAGAFNTFDYSSTTGLIKSFETYPLSLIIHFADLRSSSYDELQFQRKRTDIEIYESLKNNC